MGKFGWALLAAGAQPMAPAAATDNLAAELQPLAFLAGSCWRGTLPGNQGTDTHCFAPMLGGHFVRDRHVVTPSNYAGETIYRWDSAARRIALDYYSSEGMLMTGTAAATAQGLAFQVSYLSSGGSPVALRVAWIRDGPDSHVVTNQVREGDAWQAVPGSARFERIGPAPAG